MKRFWNPPDQHWEAFWNISWLILKHKAIKAIVVVWRPFFFCPLIVSCAEILLNTTTLTVFTKRSSDFTENGKVFRLHSFWIKAHPTLLCVLEGNWILKNVSESGFFRYENSLKKFIKVRISCFVLGFNH